MYICTYEALSLSPPSTIAELVSVVFHIHLATEKSTLGDRPQCLPLPLLLPHPPPPPPSLLPHPLPPPGFHAYL